MTFLSCSFAIVVLVWLQLNYDPSAFEHLKNAEFSKLIGGESSSLFSFFNSTIQVICYSIKAIFTVLILINGRFTISQMIPFIAIFVILSIGIRLIIIYRLLVYSALMTVLWSIVCTSPYAYSVFWKKHPPWHHKKKLYAAKILFPILCIFSVPIITSYVWCSQVAPETLGFYHSGTSKLSCAANSVVSLVLIVFEST